MQCRTHPDISGVNTCNQCGDWLCEDCAVEINGRIFCRRCLAELAGEPKPAPGRAPSAPARHISGGLLFLFSFFFPPGVNYMYEGLMKRGLAALAGFFLLVYLTAALPFKLIFGLAIPVYILACIFDGFNIRRRINAGEYVNDDIDGALMFLKRNKHILLTLLVIMLALSVLSGVISALVGPFARFLPIIVIILGLYILFNRPKRM